MEESPATAKDLQGAQRKKMSEERRRDSNKWMSAVLPSPLILAQLFQDNKSQRVLSRRASHHRKTNHTAGGREDCVLQRMNLKLFGNRNP